MTITPPCYLAHPSHMTTPLTYGHERCERANIVLVGSMSTLRAQELCESRGGRPGLHVSNCPYGLCGRRATLNSNSCRLKKETTVFVLLNTIAKQKKVNGNIKVLKFSFWCLVPARQHMQTCFVLFLFLSRRLKRTLILIEQHKTMQVCSASTYFKRTQADNTLTNNETKEVSQLNLRLEFVVHSLQQPQDVRFLPLHCLFAYYQFVFVF